MKLRSNLLLPRIFRIFILIAVIGIIWYVYEDYVNTTSAQNITVENKVTEEKNQSVVQGVIEIVPKPKGILIVPAE
jgi:hypothetical protein